MNDIAILHKAVNNNSNAGSTGMVFEGVMLERDQIVLANENDVPIIVDAIKKGIYCSLHVTHTDIETEVNVEYYVGPIVYSCVKEGDTSSFVLACLAENEFVIIYKSDTAPIPTDNPDPIPTDNPDPFS